jgi:diguanylate cyclase (GGDEF)-like protein
MLTNRMLVDMMLAPFDEAMQSILHCLGAQQIDVHLFDDDWPASGGITAGDGIFIYCSRQGLTAPETVRAARLHEDRDMLHDMPLTVEGRQTGYLRIRLEKRDDFDRSQFLRDGAWLAAVAARIIESERNSQLARQACIDDLTQVYNRRTFSRDMDRLIRQVIPGKKKLFVAKIDIDAFRVLNDTHGHLAGNEVLRQTARLIRENMPCAYRSGGDIFYAVFYGREKQEVLHTLECLLKRIETTPFSISGRVLHITASAGFAEFTADMQAWPAAVDLADQALYASRQAGCNRCFFYNDIQEWLARERMQLIKRHAELVEEVARLRLEVAAQKTAQSMRSMNFNQYRRFEHIRRLCDDNNIEGIIKYDGTGSTIEEMAGCFFEEGYIPEPTIDALLSELEQRIENDVNNSPVPEPFVTEWEYYLTLADPKGFPILEKTVQEFEKTVISWAVENGIDIRDREGESWIHDNAEAEE